MSDIFADDDSFDFKQLPQQLPQQLPKVARPLIPGISDPASLMTREQQLDDIPARFRLDGNRKALFQHPSIYLAEVKKLQTMVMIGFQLRAKHEAELEKLRAENLLLRQRVTDALKLFKQLKGDSNA